MKVAQPTLAALLETNILELKFVRRRSKPGYPDTRRMLCTNSSYILQSDNGYRVLNYKPPKGAPKFNAASKNLVNAWDIFVQDYRYINANNVDVISVMPGDDEFWVYFNDVINNMSSTDKERFIRK